MPFAVYLAFKTHGTRAYAIRGRLVIRRVLNHLDAPHLWGDKYGVDHWFSELHTQAYLQYADVIFHRLDLEKPTEHILGKPGGDRKILNVYVPDRWLSRLRENFSNL